MFPSIVLYNDIGPNAAEATLIIEKRIVPIIIYTIIVKNVTLQLKHLHNMPKPVSELRTSTVPLDVHKVSNIQTLKDGAERFWNIRRIQPFFPSLELLFKLESLRSPYLYGLKTKNSIQTISSPTSVYVNGNEAEIHRKTTMILPAYRTMRGDFGTSGLPCDKENATEEYERIHSPHNAAYVGALANVVLSESGCIHFPEVYGTYTGIALKHSIDISDDYDDITERPWFIQNLGHFFDLKLRTLQADEPKESMHLGDDIELHAEELEPVQTTEHVNIPPLEDSSNDLTPDNEDEFEEDGSISTGYVFAVRTCSSDGDDHEDGIGFEDEEETYAEAIFHDVPVQTTVMQKCEGTLYTLFKENTSVEKRIAWIAQVVFALAYAQRYYGFVHNDLHINNVMYVSTDKEYLYYNVSGKQYRVPTFGYIIKLIDFDRSTFSIRLSGMRDARFFMSDQFDVNDEAGGQYNVEPFYNQKYAEVKPNPSFDLVRLATSMFWDCFPKGPLNEEYHSDPLFKILMAWTTLPDGSSILFRNLDDKDTHERYRGFHLYKAISRYCKGTAVPKQQIEKLAVPYVFLERIPSGEQCLLIEP